MYIITWAPAARLTYYETLEYLLERWTFRELENFIDRTEEALSLIADNPLLYPFSHKSDIHKCVLVKQVTLFYRVRAGDIELLLFWDNRQDPAKLKL